MSFLSCSAPTVVILQLPACFTHVAFWRVASRESLVRSSRENPPMHTHLNFFTLSNTQPLHYSHLNIRYLIAKLQANLAWNKANTWLDKFNLIDKSITFWEGENSRASKSPGYQTLHNGWQNYLVFSTFKLLLLFAALGSKIFIIYKQLMIITRK